MIAELLAIRESNQQRLVQRPLLLATLVTAAFTGIVGVLRRFDPDAPAALLLAFVFIVALESVLTTEWLTRSEQRTTNDTVYRLAELVALVVVSRLVAWVGYGGWPDVAFAIRVLTEPGLLLDVPFAGVFLFALFAWAQGATYGDIFIRLRLRDSEIDFYAAPPSRRDSALNDRPIDIDRSRFVARYLRVWLYGGVFLILCAAISAADVTAFRQQPSVNRALLQNLGRLGLLPETILGLLTYFLLGFWLLSHARLTALRSRWTTDNIPAAEQIPASWRRYSWRTLLIVAFVAAFIPIGSTLAIGRILEIAVFVLLYFFNLILLFFVLLLSFLLAPFGGESLAEEGAAPRLQIPEQATPPPIATEMSETTALILGSLFWIVIIVVIVAALYFFARERGYRVENVSVRRWWTAVIDWWRRLWENVEVRVESVREAITRRTRRTGDNRRSFNFLRINALSPREQVRYYYLSTVRRAGDRGTKRGPGETPLEFVGVLRENWPESEPDLAELTDAFLAARYSPADIPPDRLERVKVTWRRVRAALRKRRTG